MPVNLTATATDPGPVDVLTYTWEITAPDNTVTTVTGDSTTFTPSQAGVHQVQLFVSDGDDTVTAQGSIAVAGGFDVVGKLHQDENLVENGSFELGPVLDGMNLYSDDLIPGWSTSATSEVTGVQFGGNFYVLTSNELSWTAASSEASSLGGHLVTINDAAEQQFLEHAFGDQLGRAWIGLNDAQTEGDFVWENGEPVGYTNWNSGEPNDYQPLGGEDYTEINFDNNGRWNDLPDSHVLLRGIVEIDPQIAAYNGSYYLLTDEANWIDAREIAQSLGGDLVTINDAGEQEFLSDTFGHVRSAWTGFTDQFNEGTFEWVFGRGLDLHELGTR